jgi:hypothetical protein
MKSKEKNLENWAIKNNIELTPEIYLLNQRSEILSQLGMIGVTLDLPGMLLESLNSAQFAEVIAGAVGRKVKRVK